MSPDPRAVLGRRAPEPDLVVRYGATRDHVVDVFLPAGPPEPRPLLVLLHGGFWREEYDRRGVRPLADALRREGFVVAAPEYRRTGGAGGWPETFEDVATVRSTLPTLLAETAPGRVGAGPALVVGHSAGGHLALWWALTAPDAERVARVIALAPVADLARAYAEGLGEGAVGALIGGSPQVHPDRYAAADTAPMLAAYDGPTDLVVLHGDEDRQVPVSHSRSLPGIALRELPGVEHFALIDPLAAPWAELRMAVSVGR